MLARVLPILALLVASLPGCLTAPPIHAIQAEHGLVRADSPLQGRLVAELLDGLAPSVRDLLPGMRERPVEIWVQHALEIYSGWPVEHEVPAFTIQGKGRIHMAEADVTRLSAALAHELVHSLLGDDWSTLPPVVEEGLADWAQEQLHPRLLPSMRADHLAKAGAALGGLRLRVYCALPGRGDVLESDFQFLGPDEMGGEPIDPIAAIDGRAARSFAFFRPYEVSVSDPRLYGLGYLVASRIIERHGVEGLHQACADARRAGLRRVPAATLLQLADLSHDLADWHGAVAERIGRGELWALGRSLVERVVDVLVSDIQPRVSGFSGIEFLRECRPRLGLVHGEANVDLIRVPGLQGALWRAWPTPPRLVLAGVWSPTASGDAVGWRASPDERTPAQR